MIYVMTKSIDKQNIFDKLITINLYLFEYIEQ